MRIPDDNFRAGIEARLGGPVPEEDYLAFIQPYEGLKNLSDIHESLKPEEIVEAPKPKPLMARVAELPENLALTRQEQAGVRSLHRLLSRIITADTDTYSEQQALRRKKNNILSILWAFGQFGDLDVEDDDKIIINSSLYGDSKEFSNIIRKRDNTLHTPARIAFTILERFGVYAEHLPIGKKAWTLTLTFDEEAGGLAALKALHRYVAGLAERYGVPTYAGKSRYKGKAYDLFSKADMQYLK
jgi:hypothetical protein